MLVQLAFNTRFNRQVESKLFKTLIIKKVFLVMKYVRDQSAN